MLTGDKSEYISQQRVSDHNYFHQFSCSRPSPFGTAQASSETTGIINADTTWTKTNSPYTLTGPVAVNTGVTLTIDPGVTVNLGAFYIQVNGTLVAKGTSTDKIYFNSVNGSPNWAIAVQLQ